MAYDPNKAHAYYERTKDLKGRPKGSSLTKPSKSPRLSHPALSKHKKAVGAQQRVVRMRNNVSKLKKALSETEAALSEKRQSARQTKKDNSDGKSTAEEKQNSKEYRDKNQSKLKSKEKKPSKGGGSSKSSSKSVSDMDVTELRARSIKIKGLLRDAKRQLSNASMELGQLAHSAIASEPHVNEQFARLQSAERIPSK